jgi:Holliday junction resolvasome RuvABC DNA-binding subunit
MDISVAGKRIRISRSLEYVRGIGPKLRARILSEYSTEELRDKDSEDLQQIEGVGPSPAGRIQHRLGK